jgi:DNA-binding response OmpR family regulator
MRIAVLNLDRSETELICAVLDAAGHACERHRDGKSLLEQLAGAGFDLLLIDGQAGDGIALLGRVRAAAARLPIMYLAGRSGDDEIVPALEAGADDYIVKPLRRRELALRVRAQLKRAYPQASETQQQSFGAYAFETPSGRLTLDGKTVEVTQKEFELALLFFRHLDRPLSRAYIQEAIWPGQPDTGRSVDTHVSRVRSKLGLRPENGFRLAPVYSYGYRLERLAR